MARHHSERAFEKLLRTREIPYLSVRDAKRALLPASAALRATDASGEHALKSFDFAVYGRDENLLVEIKGRKLRPGPRPRLESWVTMDDVDSLAKWRTLFGEGFEAAIVFVYECDLQPPDGLFDEIIEHDGRWFTFRAIGLDDYRSAMRVRSPRWRTVHLATEDFQRLARPFAPPANGETPESTALDPIPAASGPTDRLPARLGPRIPIASPR